MDIEQAEIIIWAAAGILAVIQLIYTFVIYNAPHRHSAAERKGKLHLADHQPGISVVIATADYAHSLEKHLPLILEQDYPDFEVIVVDDNSKDDTSDLLQRLSKKYPHLYHTYTSDSIRYISHKKLALMLGIKAAQKEWIVFTEPDCYPTSPQWLSCMARHFTDSTDVVLGYSNYERKPGFANLCYMFDTLQQQLRLLGLTLRGGGYIGIGRNMAYRKEIFFKNKGYSRHLDLERGEDDLFVNEHVPACRITVAASPQSTVRYTSSSFRSWKADRLNRLFIRKKLRGMGPYILGADTLSRTLLYAVIIVGIVIAINHHWWSTLAISVGLWLTTLGCREYVYHQVARLFGERCYNISLPLFALLHPCWELYLRLSLLFSSKQTFLRRKI